MKLFWYQDNYYLIGKSQDDWKHFRVDRIVQIETTPKTFRRDPSFDSNQYVKSLCNMYAGDVQYVDIRFHNHLINVVVDKFGPDINIQLDGEEHFILRFGLLVTAWSGGY